MLLQLLPLLLLLCVGATLPPTPYEVTDHLHYLTGTLDAVTWWSTVDTAAAVSADPEYLTCYLTGSYLPNTNVTGWDQLEIQLSPDRAVSLSLEELLYVRYSAGYLEGHLTCESILLQWLNFYSDNFGDDPPDPLVVQFVVDNYEYMKTEAARGMHSSDYWLFVHTALLQLNGMVAGCQDYSSSDGSYKLITLDSGASPLLIPPLLSVVDDNSRLVDVGHASLLLKILLMNAWGDLYTITTKVFLEELLDDSKTVKARRVSYPRKKVERDLRCSALFKVLPDYSDILFGHTTWCSYEAMG